MEEQHPFKDAFKRGLGWSLGVSAGGAILCLILAVIADSDGYEEE